MAADTETSAPGGADETWPSPEQGPAALFGRPGPDRFMRRLTIFADTYIDLRNKVRESLGQTTPREPGPGLSHWRKLVVASRAREADGVVSLRLEAPGGGPLPPWQPGAHLQLELPSGTIRHYSLNGDPSDRTSYRIAVRRIADGGGGSTEIHDSVTQGTVLRATGPVNAFPFAVDRAASAGADHYVSPALAGSDLDRWVADLTRRTIRGTHWSVLEERRSWS